MISDIIILSAVIIIVNRKFRQTTTNYFHSDSIRKSMETFVRKTKQPKLISESEITARISNNVMTTHDTWMPQFQLVL